MIELPSPAGEGMIIRVTGDGSESPGTVLFDSSLALC